MKDKNKIYFYIAIFLLLTLFYFNFNFSTFKEGLDPITVTGQARPLSLSANGMQIYIPSNPWQKYQNLPNYLIGLIATTSINNPQSISFKVNTEGTMYMLHRLGWKAVSFVNWTLLGSGPYISQEGTILVYSQKLKVGTYTFSDFSAMYMFKPDPFVPLLPVPPLPNWDPYELNTDYSHNDINGGKLLNSTPTACLANCNADPLCKGFVFNSANNDCWKKSAMNITDKKTGITGLYSYKKTVTGSGTTGSGTTGSGTTGSGSTGSGSGTDSGTTGSGTKTDSCSSILNDLLQNEKATRDATAQSIKEDQQYIYDQANIFAAPAIAQVNVNTGIIKALKKEYDDLFKQMTDQQNAATNARIRELERDASNTSSDAKKTSNRLINQISDYEKSIENKQNKLDDIKHRLEIEEAVDRQAKKGDIRYDELNNGINREISNKIGGYTTQNTLQKTMRDICDNVISSIGNTTKVLTDNMGNFVGPDGLLSKFNGFTNDNSLYNSIDKIDSSVSEQDSILKNILYTLKYYSENKDKVDSSGNVVTPIPYESNSLLHIDTNQFCVSDYDDKLGEPLCCGRSGKVDETNLNDQCGPYAKYCVKVPKKQYGFCSSIKPAVT